MQVDYATQSSYTVTISAVDPNIPDCPPATLDYTLAVTASTLIEETWVESGVWDPVPDTAYATHVEEVDGWRSSTGTIELRNNVVQDGDAAEGVQFIELNTDPSDRFPDGSDIYKELSTVAGEDYTIKVQYAGRSGYDATVNRFELLVDDVSQGIWGR